MKKEFLILASLLFLFGVSDVAFANGAYFPVVHKVASSADQRVILVKEGSEVSMTLSTGYTGEGDKFAWIIPVPEQVNADSVRESGDDAESLFKSLDDETAPVFIKKSDPTPPQNCGGCGGSGSGSDKSQSSASLNIEKLTLESYEGHVLFGESAKNIITWLQDNDYQVDTEAEPVLTSYVDDGFSFVALKLKPSEYRSYTNEYLPPVTVQYQADYLLFPFYISSVSTADTARVLLYVISTTTWSSSNYPTKQLEYDRGPFDVQDYEGHIKEKIKQTLDGKAGLVIIYSGYFYETSASLISSVSGIDISKDTELSVTRLESFMEPAMMNDDIYFQPDSDTRHFSVGIEVATAYRHFPGVFFAMAFVVTGVKRRRKERISAWVIAALLSFICLV